MPLLAGQYGAGMVCFGTMAALTDNSCKVFGGPFAGCEAHEDAAKVRVPRQEDQRGYVLAAVPSSTWSVPGTAAHEEKQACSDLAGPEHSMG